MFSIGHLSASTQQRLRVYAFDAFSLICLIAVAAKVVVSYHRRRPHACTKIDRCRCVNAVLPRRAQPLRGIRYLNTWPLRGCDGQRPFGLPSALSLGRKATRAHSGGCALADYRRSEDGSTGGSSGSAQEDLDQALADASAALQDRTDAYADNDLVGAAEADARMTEALERAPMRRRERERALRVAKRARRRAKRRRGARERAGV